MRAHIAFLGIGIATLTTLGVITSAQPGGGTPATGSAASDTAFRWVEKDLGDGLRLEAESDGYQWTGIAVTPDNDFVVSYPNWGNPYDNAVELLQRGVDKPIPWPDWSWNQWDDLTGDRDVDRRARIAGDEHFICVQALWRDNEGTIWALDPANPRFEGVLERGVKVAAKGDRHRGGFTVNIQSCSDCISEDTYLNDIRFSNDGNIAYITDSGTGGILVCVGHWAKAKLFLADHPSTHADPDFTPVIGGKQWRVNGDGDVPQIHSDGIALSPDGKWLYWQALTAKRLYRIPTAVLRDFTMPDDEVATYVEDMGETVMTDGMIFDNRGNLYFSALEHDAIMYRTPEGDIKTLVEHPQIAWPDSFSIGPDRRLYFTTSQIHRTARFRKDGKGPAEPYRLFSVPLAGTQRATRSPQPQNPVR